MQVTKQVKKEQAKEGIAISPYCFRHRYAYQLDERGFNTRHAANFMGNSREVFTRNYGEKARKQELIAAASKALGNSEARLSDGIRQQALR